MITAEQYIATAFNEIICREVSLSGWMLEGKTSWIPQKDSTTVENISR